MCFHLARVPADSPLFDCYRRLLQHLVFPTSDQDRSLKVKIRRCVVCTSRPALLVYCLHCVHCACLSRKHASVHAKEKDHPFGLDSRTGEVWCAECGDFVYSHETEKMRREAENRMRRELRMSLVHRWNPNSEELELLKQPLDRHPPASLGLRGLLNLGNTCFMSCILQAMTHTPLLRDYFLSDQHRCPPRSKSGCDSSGACLMCQMAEMFQEFYGGSSRPHVPFRMLHLVWTHARHLAGYEQQDAHEFFIATLDVLHRHSRSSAAAAAADDCGCIIHRIFTGRLQSDVACPACRGTSRTVDPYWDISLELGLEPASELRRALARFTRQEELGSEARCSMCGAGGLTKQLSLLSLPIVACFHLKRFEHSSKLHKKIRSSLSFPEYLDLSEFTAAARAAPDDASPSEAALRRQDNHYALFAVVNHHGTMESGHYTCFVRQSADEWFMADDHVISKATKAQVLASEGYLLFYHQHFLNYT